MFINGLWMVLGYFIFSGLNVHVEKNFKVKNKKEYINFIKEKKKKIKLLKKFIKHINLVYITIAITLLWYFCQFIPSVCFAFLFYHITLLLMNAVIHDRLIYKNQKYFIYCFLPFYYVKNIHYRCKNNWIKNPSRYSRSRTRWSNKVYSSVVQSENRTQISNRLCRG